MSSHPSLLCDFVISFNHLTKWSTVWLLALLGWAGHDICIHLKNKLSRDNNPPLFVLYQFKQEVKHQEWHRPIIIKMLAQRQKTEEKYLSVVYCLAYTAFEISNYLQNFNIFYSDLMFFSLSEEFIFMVIFYCTFWNGSFTFIDLEIWIWT